MITKYKNSPVGVSTLAIHHKNLTIFDHDEALTIFDHDEANVFNIWYVLYMAYILIGHYSKS